MAYSIDTRTLLPGDTYVAVRGELHDGHDFVSRAIELGAAAVIIDRAAAEAGLGGNEAGNDGAIAIDMPVETTIVDDTIQHLTALASQRVKDHGNDIIAITGSVGKTTTKSAVVAVLREAFPVVAAAGNLNTPLGLSLTVLNADLTDDNTKIVMEMGARMIGDIDELATLFPPTVSVVTNVKPVHLETFGSIEGIEHEKGNLIARLGADGTGVLNADDARVRAMVQRTVAACVLYGRAPDAEIRPADVTVDLPILGDHAVLTAMAATAVGRVFGMSAEQINRGLSAITPEPGRLVRLRGRADSTLIDDTYNASPDATNAALDVLARLPVQRRIALLGDMLELGSDEVSEHRRVLARASEVADVVIAVGPLMAEAAGTDSSIMLFADSTAAATALGTVPVIELGPEVGCLVKGSQGVRMERVTEVLLHPDLDPVDVLARQTDAWKSK